MMSSKRWQQVESLFHAALIREAGERGIFLSEACSFDPTLQLEVESLLAAHERTGPADLAIQDLLSDLIEETDLYLTPGQLINHYQVVGLIGKGGMGIVYKAEDTRLMRTVAIKVFSKRSDSKWAAEAGYLREARAGSAINHPNIVTIHEIGETADITYIIMEYVEAETLSELIASRALDPEEILIIAIQICDGMAEVHSRQIIHRDVKPANVMVSGRGQVKLLDFGIAKPFHMPPDQKDAALDPKAQTKSSEVAGTICYMSPEQIRGESLDERTDIFSFGVLFYEMITGTIPFTGHRVMDVASSIVKDPPAPFGPAPEGVPRQLRDLVMRCLEKEREKRPSSFIQIRKELQEMRLLNSPVTTSQRQEDKSPRPGDSFAVRATHEFNYKPKAPAIPIILVLPLEAIGSREGEDSLGSGFSHMISTNLARIKGLSVISKAAVERQSERLTNSVLELARELGATLLMEGEMMTLTDGYAIMVRLSEVATGHIIWGSQYFGDSSDLFRIQQALCREIAFALKVDISPSDEQRIARVSTGDIEAFEPYSQARALLDRYDVKENIDDAMGLLEEAVKQHPRFALPFAGLSEAYWHKYLLTLDETWVTRAIAACDRALVLDPYQPEVYISLANIYYNTGRLEQAIGYFERAIEIQPASDRALRGLGWCYQKKGDKESAISYLERAIESRPGCWYYYNDLGKCYYAFGFYERAAEQFRRVIAVQPDTYNGYNNLGVMYCLLGLYEDAIAMHKRAIEIHASEEAFSNLGTEYFYLGRFEEAAEEYQRAIDLFPTQDMFSFNLGEAYLQLGRQKEALQQFERARQLLADHLKVKKGDGQLYGRMALYLAKLGRRDEARHNITGALSLEPKNPLLIFQQAVVYALAGETEQAIESLRAALELGYSKTEAMHDPNLKPLWQNAEVRSLLDM
jgi:serine/threonine protein kinase/tetratricopeptide (TPR) repeat protein